MDTQYPSLKHAINYSFLVYPTFLTIRMVANILGKSTDTIHRYANDPNGLRCIKLKSGKHFLKQDVIDYLSRKEYLIR